MKKPVIIVIVVAVVLLAVGGFALKKVQQKIGEKVGETIVEKAIEKGTGGNVDISNGGKEMTITGKDGAKVTIGGNKIPDNFPKDIPIYPGSTPSGSWSGSNSNKNESGHFVVLETGDSYDKVVAYYKAELPKQGWSIENALDSTDAAILTIKKDTRNGSVTIGRDGEGKKTSITLVVGSDSSNTSQ